MLLAGLALALVPVAILAVGIRREARARLAAQYQRQADTLVTRAVAALARESDAVAARLARLRGALADDNRLRLALQRDAADRAYVLDYAARAARLSGLDLLRLHDADGVILSSGHYRNEYGRRDAATPRALAAAGAAVPLLEARSAESTFVTLARVDTVWLGGRTLTLVGGRTLDSTLLSGLAGAGDLRLRLELPGSAFRDPPSVPARETAASTATAVVRVHPLPFVGADGASGAARLVATASLEPLAALVRGLDRWFAAALIVVGLGAVGLAAWFAAGVSRPLTALAQKTDRLDLDRLDVDFATDRRDEIGGLERLLAALTGRLRAGAARLREAERRLATGELARQVNHDVKNGLIPVRNVLRHLGDVARDEPARLPEVFAERRATLDAGLAYLESLAATYARLSPAPDAARACDANAVIREVVGGMPRRDGVALELSLAEALPAVRGDAVMVRRIVENLVANALESLPATGTVRVATEPVDGAGAPRVRLSVADTGPGMTRAQLDRAFEDFFTTKPGGTGLGLSIVRRLVLDLEGTLRVETAPGQGAAFRIELPGGTS
jgi:signal transduction histidine kinase